MPFPMSWQSARAIEVNQLSWKGRSARSFREDTPGCFPRRGREREVQEGAAVMGRVKGLLSGHRRRALLLVDVEPG